jgi:hypothetical protein
VCASDCTTRPGAVASYCGDGIVNGPEACADGNATTEATCPYGEMSCRVCASDCTEQPGAAPGGYCGDGVINTRPVDSRQAGAGRIATSSPRLIG